MLSFMRQVAALLYAIERCLKVGRALREEESVMHSGAMGRIRRYIAPRSTILRIKMCKKER